MKELLLIVAAVVGAMGAVALSIGPGHDTTVLVSPPEAVAEEFVRKLATGRYDRATEDLSDDAGAAPTLEAQGKSLRARAGAVSSVEGEPGTIAGGTATASARICTSQAGEVQWTFTLVRRHGLWKIETDGSALDRVVNRGSREKFEVTRQH